MPSGPVVLQRLAVRRNQVLAQMSILSDAKGASFVGGGPRGKAESKPPTTAGGSLYDLWRERFDVDWPDVPENPDQAAVDWCEARAYKLCIEAEADLRWARGELDVTAPLGDPEARDKRIIKEHEGRPAVEVAHLERCSTASVRAIRRAVGRDADTGRRK